MRKRTLASAFVGACQAIVAGSIGAAAGFSVGHPFGGLGLATFGVVVGIVGTWIIEDFVE